MVTDVICQLEAEFGMEAPLTIMCGKIQDYSGMVQDYTIDGKIQIKMNKYVVTVLEEAPLDMKGESATPAAAHLFEMNQTNATLLDAETADEFHHIVAKLLSLCKQAQLDIQTSVSFLCTQVKAPDTDDYKKLAWVIRYLWATADMPLT